MESSSYTLVIVESPSKCKKIEQFLNKPQQSKPQQGKHQQSKLYKCIASYGHIRELSGLESIDIHNNFAPTFTNCESKKEQIAKIRKAIKDANEVILASDDDREGEAIAWHLCQVFNLPLKTTKRIIFHEITESALHKAIETPTLVNMQVVYAQLARQVLDMLVGYKLSPVLWQHVKDGLSAGRCQTPALRIIYENQKEIDIAPGKKSYTITGYFTNQHIPFILNYEESDETKMQEFLKASASYSHTYKECKAQNKTRSPPEPFTTSSLQQTCSNELHISPKETMSICQILYEEGHITYPRTDSKTYSDEFITVAKDYIKSTHGDEYVRQTTTKKRETEQETVQAHEAIRATHIDCKTLEESATVTSKVCRVYRLIYQRTLESCMADSIVSVLSTKIDAPFEHEYQYTTEQIVFAGWKIVNNSAESNKYYTYLQSLKQNMSIPFHKIKANIHLKELKSHYTEARLVQLLEEKGIGRPSTFSSLVEKIQERKYVKKENIKGKLIPCTDYELIGKELIKINMEKEFGNEKNKLVIQPLGIIALEFLLEHYDNLFEYSYTKEMEDDLDAVARNEKVWYEVCRKCYSEIEKLSATVSKRGKETIRIDDNHTYMIGKYGPVIKCTGTSGAGTSGAGTSKGTSKGTKTKSSNVSFKPVRKDIDLNKLRRGEYTLDDVLEKNESNLVPSIGIYKGKPVYIKVGKFGKYLEWNNITKSLKHLKQEVSEITMEDIAEILYDNSTCVAADTSVADTSVADTSVAAGGILSDNLRVITEDASIRKGRYGHYIFYKTKKMKKPRFLKLDGFVGDYLKCELSVLQEWFKTTYDI